MFSAGKNYIEAGISSGSPQRGCLATLHAEKRRWIGAL